MKFDLKVSIFRVSFSKKPLIVSGLINQRFTANDNFQNLFWSRHRWINFFQSSDELSEQKIFQSLLTVRVQQLKSVLDPIISFLSFYFLQRLRVKRLIFGQR